jgi:hypothetical protein
MVTFVLMVVIWNTSLDRARRAASKWCDFRKWHCTGAGSNISKKYFFEKICSMIKIHIFICTRWYGILF